MLLVVLILSIVTMCVTVVCTYFLLNAEDYRWSVSSFHFSHSGHFICLMSGHFGLGSIDNEFSCRNDILPHNLGYGKDVVRKETTLNE